MAGRLIKRENTASIILAAGDSTRMGRPKALLPYQGKTFLNKLVDDFEQIGCQPIVIILGKAAPQIQPQLKGYDVSIEINHHPEKGPLSSLQIGLQCLPPNCPGFFFCPVDHPAVKIKTLKNMLLAWKGSPKNVIRPSFQGRRGHPVLLGRDWIEIVRVLPLSSNMRELLCQRIENVIDLPVSDPGILTNVDTPSDYQQLTDKSDQNASK